MNIEDTKKAMLAELSKYTEIPKDKEEDVLNFLFSAFFQVEVEDLQEVVEDLEAKRLEEFDRAADDAISNREDEAITFKNLMLAMEQQQAFDRDTDDAIRDRLETEGVV